MKNALKTTTLAASLLLAALCGGCSGFSSMAAADPMAEHAAHVAAAKATDRPSTHGMLIVGEKTVYLSHLPMFHSPHDYQVILEARFGGPLGKVYAADRAQTHTPIYTLVPETFVLPEVVQAKRSFHAAVFRGHFERGGKAIAEDVTVDITRMLLFKKFDPKASKPSTYQGFLFGQGDETFLAHLIAARPDFDQVVAVRPDRALPAAALAAGVPVTATGANQALTVGAQAMTDGALGAVGLKVQTEFYHETGDLEM